MTCADISHAYALPRGVLFCFRTVSERIAMTEIITLEKGSELWEQTASYAEQCSWRAGAELARQMREDCIRGWERVFAALEDGKIVGYCTLTEKDELPPEQPYTPLIGFVFVDESCRGHRISEQLIRAAIGYAGSIGFGKVYIMSGEVGLYERYGFAETGEFETIYGDREKLLYIAVPSKGDGNG